MFEREHDDRLQSDNLKLLDVSQQSIEDYD